MQTHKVRINLNESYSFGPNVKAIVSFSPTHTHIKRHATTHKHTNAHTHSPEPPGIHCVRDCAKKSNRAQEYAGRLSVQHPIVRWMPSSKSAGQPLPQKTHTHTNILTHTRKHPNTRTHTHLSVRFVWLPHEQNLASTSTHTRTHTPTHMTLIAVK